MPILIGSDQLPAATANSSTSFGHTTWNGTMPGIAGGTATHLYVRFATAQAGSYAFAVFDANNNLVGQTVVGTDASTGVVGLDMVQPFVVNESASYYFGIRASASRDIVGDDTVGTWNRRNDGLRTWDTAFLDPRDPAAGAGSNRRQPMIWVEGTLGASLLIESVEPDPITPLSTPAIFGTAFGATPAAVLLSPTNDRTNVAATAQTIGAGAGDTSIPLTGVVLPAGTTGGDTLWYFVQAQDLTWSAGFPVTFSVQPALSLPEVFDATLDGFSFRFTTDTGNGTAIWAAYATTAERNSASVENIQAEIITPATSLARGEFTVTTTGVQTVSAITGLGAAQTRYVRVFHDGDVTA